MKPGICTSDWRKKRKKDRKKNFYRIWNYAALNPGTRSPCFRNHREHWTFLQNRPQGVKPGIPKKDDQTISARSHMTRHEKFHTRLSFPMPYSTSVEEVRINMIYFKFYFTALFHKNISTFLFQTLKKKKREVSSSPITAHPHSPPNYNSQANQKSQWPKRSMWTHHLG